MVTSVPSAASTRTLDTTCPNKTVWYVPGSLTRNVMMPHLAMQTPGMFAYDKPFLVTPDEHGQIVKITGMAIGYQLLLEELCKRGAVKHISVNSTSGPGFGLMLFVEAKGTVLDTLLNFINTLRFIRANGEGIASLGVATIAREAELEPSDLTDLDLNNRTSTIAARLLDTAERAMSALMANCAIELEFAQFAS